MRDMAIRLPFRTVVRFGSTWAGDDKNRVECNSVEAVKNSASKLRMKQAFQAANVITADWFQTNGETMIYKNGEATILNLPDLPWPIVAKSLFGSRGRGNYLLQSLQEYHQWVRNKDVDNYIFEKYYDYNREYRLHVSANGCFYTCRKVLKNDTPEEDRWFRNDSNSNWIVEENPLFDKPVNWNAIVAESVKALQAVGLDVGAIDVKVQSAKDSKDRVRQDPKFIILETNSAPSFGKITLEKYAREIPQILLRKANQD
jgi:glutathione synthase/RimK-type ligase-like ATP-grasp enzyme